jgi:hypothetical protein
MPTSSVASGTFSSRKAANQAVRRLVDSGFARNSIEVRPTEDDEGWELEVHARKENLRRARRLINDASAPMQAVDDVMSGAVHGAKSYPLLVLGAGLLAGFAIYSLISHREPQQNRSRRR